MGLAGCTAADPVASTDQATQSTVSAEDGAVSFVSLKVPNMH